MKVNQLYKSENHFGSNYHKFISMIPGYELTECIEAVVQYCKENNTSAFLEFNGSSNRIESYIDPIEMARCWFQAPGNLWYNAQKVKNRDNKLNQILK